MEVDFVFYFCIIERIEIKIWILNLFFIINLMLYLYKLYVLIEFRYLFWGENRI